MRKIAFLLAFLLTALTLAAAQTQTRERRSSNADSASRSESTVVRSRVVGATGAANHSEKPTVVIQEQGQTSNGQASGTKSPPSWGDTAVVTTSRPAEKPPAPARNSVVNDVTLGQSNQRKPKLVEQTVMAADAPSVRLLPPPTRAKVSRTLSSPRSPAATVIYRVGVGDVLDIRLLNMPTRESTLFTVLKNGAVEYPLLREPAIVEGMTTDEIARLLGTEIKVIAGARAIVSVRDYASHGVIVTGLVDNPGRKILRREAMPLYAVLAESLPRPEASGATLIRNGKEEVVSLTDGKAMSTLVLPGDVIKVAGGSTTPKRFFYVGGDVNAPGEKEFREGMTLTQALLSAGGASRPAKNSVKVARRNRNGFLITNEYNLYSIAEGKSRDPLVEAGDRIEVTRGM